MSSAGSVRVACPLPLKWVSLWEQVDPRANVDVESVDPEDLPIYLDLSAPSFHSAAFAEFLLAHMLDAMRPEDRSHDPEKHDTAQQESIDSQTPPNETEKGLHMAKSRSRAPVVHEKVPRPTTHITLGCG